MTYRVIQWGTGSVGKQALREVLRNPEFVLAGVKVYGDAKVGKDAGELCGMPATGILASQDPAVAKGDTVLYCPIVADYDEIARSIESIRAKCQELGRDPATVSSRCSLTPTSWRVPPPVDDLIDAAVASGQRLAGLGVTNFTVPLNYYQLDLDALQRLLKALRAA